ncbi:unnamed protein product [Hydatigera taeniaeformis]|uniref:DUF5734 domain-containing protein n=1 Tax=Hydatigena taeniaeformis TaxID=6205 RepID=A0A0R3WKY8_HYDTA|nr:unnamed protein product [Hydatigera taeniaeformis]
MDKPVKPTKKDKEVQIRTPLRFLDHTKVKKNQQLEAILERENSYLHTSTTATYIGKIFKNRIEFAGEKNAKKPPVKRIKFSQVERIIPNDDALCVHVGWRQGKSVSVTSFAFTEEAVYNGFINNLESTRGFAQDSKNQANQSAGTETFYRPTPSSPSPRWENSEKNAEPSIHRRLSEGYTTSYIMWEEPQARTHHDMKSANLHMPINEAPSSFGTSDTEENVKIVGREEEEEEEEQTVTEENMDEVHHCPCCVQRSGINLKLSNQHLKAYAPSTERGQSYTNFPAHLSHNYKCYRPHQARTTSSMSRESTTDFNETLFDTFNDSDSTMLYPIRSRPRSLPPPIQSTRNVARPAAPQQRHQQTHHQQKFVPKVPRSYQHTLTVDSSSSSGYTSATFHEDGLELIVDPTTSGQYIRNQKRFVTGRVHSRNRNEPAYYYRKNPSSLPRIPRVRDYD